MKDFLVNSFVVEYVAYWIWFLSLVVVGGAAFVARERAAGRRLRKAMRDSEIRDPD